MAAAGPIDATITRRVFVKRWTGFVAAMWLMIFSGSYGFSNYSSELKEVLGLNQKQLNRISVAKDLGDACGILAGILTNYLPTSVLLCIGACVGFVGYGSQWLVVSRVIDPLPYWVMLIAAMVAGNTLSWMNTSVFTVSVRNFPCNRGPVVGLFKAYMGLSAAIFSSVCESFFDSSPSVYLLMLTTIPPTFCLIAAAFFRPVPPAETAEEVKAEQGSLFAFNIMASILAIYIIVQDFVPQLKQGTVMPLSQALLVVILVAPALVPLWFFHRLSKDSKGGEESLIIEKSTLEKSIVSFNGKALHGDMEKDLLKQPLLDHQNELSDRKDGMIGYTPKEPHHLELGDDRTTLSLFKTWHVYVLYFALFCGAGTGMAFSNNLGQVGQSFGFSTVTLFTSLFSLGNFFGRIGSGNVSEYFIRAMSMPRPAWMGIGKVPMVALYIWMSIGSRASLYAGSLVLGFCHGGMVTLCIPTISEFYGLKYFGTNYMVINTHLLAGSSIFSGVIAGYLYDRHATTDAGGQLTCYGASCYGTTFLVYSAFLTVALAMDGILTFISRPLYRKLRARNIAVVTDINAGK